MQYGREIVAVAIFILAAHPASAQQAPKSDFVPGQTVIYQDDFGRVPEGMLPRNLRLTGGNVDVSRSDRGPALRMTSDTTDFSLLLPAQVPERFTLEFSIAMPPQLGWDQSLFLDAPGPNGVRIVDWHSEAGIEDNSVEPQRRFMSDIPRSAAESEAEVDDPPPRWDRLQVMADGNFVKVYVNGVRVANAPNVPLGRSNALHFSIRATQRHPVFISGIRLASGGKDFYRALLEDGQVTLEGIEFETGSDVLKPTSDTQLQRAAEYLRDKSDLRLIVQGHTDDVGEAAANQKLSERRAASVIKRLSQLGLADSQMRAEGVGEGQPIATNATSVGRARNRRVVLLRDY